MNKLLNRHNETTQHFDEAIRQDALMFRWIRVSPYLLLSWLAAGFSLPIAINIVLNTQQSAIQTILASSWQSEQSAKLFKTFLDAKLGATQNKLGIAANVAALAGSVYFRPYKTYQPSSQLTHRAYNYFLITQLDAFTQHLINHRLVTSKLSVFSSKPHFLFITFDYSLQQWFARSAAQPASPDFIV